MQTRKKPQDAEDNKQNNYEISLSEADTEAVSQFITKLKDELDSVEYEHIIAPRTPGEDPVISNQKIQLSLAPKERAHLKKIFDELLLFPSQKAIYEKALEASQNAAEKKISDLAQKIEELHSQHQKSITSAKEASDSKIAELNHTIASLKSQNTKFSDVFKLNKQRSEEKDKTITQLQAATLEKDTHIHDLLLVKSQLEKTLEATKKSEKLMQSELNEQKEIISKRELDIRKKEETIQSATTMHPPAADLEKSKLDLINIQEELAKKNELLAQLKKELEEKSNELAQQKSLLSKAQKSLIELTETLNKTSQALSQARFDVSAKQHIIKRYQDQLKDSTSPKPEEEHRVTSSLSYRIGIKASSE